jgi:hypothetical protein
MNKSLKKEIYNRLTFFSEQRDKWEYDKCTKDILNIIKKRIEYEIDHTSLGDCPECFGDGLKRFGEMLDES